MKRKKKKDTVYQASGPKPSVKKHLKALGFSNVQSYFGWCAAAGFPMSVDKQRDDLNRELLTFERQQETQKSQVRVHHNPVRFLEAACFGELEPAEVTRVGWHEVCEAIARSKKGKQYRRSLANFLTTLQTKTKFVFATTAYGTSTFYYIHALIQIHEYQSVWLRSLDNWVPTTHNMYGQFTSLLNHLFLQYAVPDFMNSAWFRTDRLAKTYRDWYLHMAAGYNIRKACLLVPMNKKMAHHFMQASNVCSIEQALNWANVQALEGDERLANAILASKIGENLKNYAFWTSVIRFFVDNPMLERTHVGPIVDYLYAQKFERRECVTGPGIVEHIPPPQPNLSMKGRTPDALLKQVEQWHGNLAKSSGAQKYFFKRLGIPEFRQATGPKKQMIWQIKELLSGAQLIEEGQAMKHCVASYARVCALGYCSIWAMTCVTPHGAKKHQTIEVSREKVIVQCRGLNNRLPTAEEFAVIQKWSIAAGLSISPRLLQWMEGR